MSTQPPVEQKTAEGNIIAEQTYALAELIAKADRILPTLDLKRGFGQIEIPHVTEGIRDSMTIELGFAAEQAGNITVRDYGEQGVSLSVVRGPKNKKGEVDWKRENFMQAGYKNDGDATPDGLKVVIALDENGNSGNLYFDADGSLTSIMVSDEYRDSHKEEDIGQSSEEQRRWFSNKLALKLNPSEDGFNRPIDIKKTLEEFINADEPGGIVLGTELRAPRLVYIG